MESLHFSCSALPNKRLSETDETLSLCPALCVTRVKCADRSVSNGTQPSAWNFHFALSFYQRQVHTRITQNTFVCPRQSSNFVWVLFSGEKIKYSAMKIMCSTICLLSAAVSVGTMWSASFSSCVLSFAVFFSAVLLLVYILHDSEILSVINYF